MRYLIQFIIWLVLMFITSKVSPEFFEKHCFIVVSGFGALSYIIVQLGIFVLFVVKQ